MSAKQKHERILQEGLALLSQTGLQGITLGILAERVGMSKSGLFAHFRSKEAIQVELLQHITQFGAALIMEPLLSTEEGLPRLRALLDFWFGWSERAGLPGGCPIAAALFEVDDMAGPVRDQVLLMEEEWRAFLCQMVEQAIERGHLRNDLDTDQFVWELCGLYLGHHASQRFLRAPDADKRAQTAFDALIARAAPKPD